MSGDFKDGDIIKKMTGPRRRIVAMQGGGADKHGEVVVFALELEDGSLEPFEMDHSAVGRTVTLLTGLGAIAENDRAGRPGGLSVDGLVQPIESSGRTRVGRASDGQIVIQFRTGPGPGLPIPMSISREEAKGLAKALRDVLLRAAPARRPSH